jgi:hypothetical protein
LKKFSFNDKDLQYKIDQKINMNDKNLVEIEELREKNKIL